MPQTQKIKNSEINQIISPGENILWSQKPLFWPYMFWNVLPIAFFSLLWNGIMALGVVPSLLAHNYLILLVPHVWVGIGLLLYPFWVWISYNKAYYYITNRRVIIQSGIVGTDFGLVDFRQIVDSEVDVGLVDKMLKYNSGNINLTLSGLTSQNRTLVNKTMRLIGVINVYQLFNWLKTISYSVATDIQYPNALRPDTNPGYNTKSVFEDTAPRSF